MNKIEQQNAAYKVDGYYSPSPGQRESAAFEAARATCLKHLHRQIECIEAITLEKFLYEKKKGFR